MIFSIRWIAVLAACLVSVLSIAQAQGKETGASFNSHPQRVKKWYVHTQLERQYGSSYTERATAYSLGCDASGGGDTTAMGTHVRFGEVANNYLSLGTKIMFRRPIHGRKRFVVEDRIGWGSALDIWVPCKWLGSWTNPTVTFRTYRIVKVKRKYYRWIIPDVRKGNE